MEVFTIAPEAGKTYTSKKGYPCKSDRDIASTTPEVRLGWGGVEGKGIDTPVYPLSLPSLQSILYTGVGCTGNPGRMGS